MSSPLPRPTILPEWATDIEQNGINGQFNVIVPPPEKRRVGWVFKEKPNRQYWNWLHRTAGQWIAYFAENLDFDADLFIPNFSGLDPASINQIFGYYSIVGDKCFFTITLTWNGNATTGAFTVTNMPFTAKNVTGFLQSCHVTRGSGPTLVGSGIISGLINPNTTQMDIWSEDSSTGTGQTVSIAGNQGQLIISGFYFIEQPI